MSDRNWVGRGGGREPGQPTLELRGGAGMGSGRLTATATLEIRGGAGRGGGRAGGQPSVDFSGGGSFRGASSHSSATTGGNKDPRVADPEGSFIFALEIEGTEVAHFTECSGLKSSTEIFELQEGGMNHRVHKLPGQSKWENVTLRYGVTSDVSLPLWRNEILQDQFGNRRNGAIVMKTLAGDEVRRYNFIQAWPVSWDGPSFSSSSSELAIESIELAHNGIQIT